MTALTITNPEEYKAACNILFKSMTSEDPVDVRSMVFNISLMTSVQDYEIKHDIKDSVFTRITEEMCNLGYFTTLMMKH